MELAQDSGLWFKVKGEKHSVSKVKTLAEVDPIRLQHMREFVEYAVTENRLEQGLGEVGLDQAKIGEFIGWVNRDINKEEGDVLEANALTMKDVAKFISNKSRGWYMQKLNENL
ncbi:RNA ligase 2 [Salmonella phage 40]|nr:RNA ligase 2 [Salmonella phage 40]